MLICSEIDKLGDLLHQANNVYTNLENHNNYGFVCKALFDNNVQDLKNIIKEIYEKLRVISILSSQKELED